MRLFSKEATRYAVLLICLFGIATLAVRHVLAFIGDRATPGAYPVIALLVCVITFGFMLIAGAFGLLGIQLTAAAEGRRRVARLIEAMDYIQDGLLAVDPKGRITAANPAVHRIAAKDVDTGIPLQQVFDCLAETDVADLLAARDPAEIERKHSQTGGLRTLRFRSQPVEGMVLLLVSDVTRMEIERMHNRQVARLQLIGQVARGVAFDFNNLLCAIAGHAALIARLPADSPESLRSVHAITKGAERGTALAAHLVALSTPAVTPPLPRLRAEYIQMAVNNLRDSLPESWKLIAKCDEVPPMSLTGLKIEQVVLNLGLIVAERSPEPGTLHIVVAAPDPNVPLLNVGTRFAGVILVSAMPPAVAATPEPMRDESLISGVIVSVIRTLIDQANGILECFRGGDNAPLFRVALPLESADTAASLPSGFPSDLAPYVAGWRILVLAPPPTPSQELPAHLRALSGHVEILDNLMTVLARLEDKRPVDALIIDQRAIPMETRALLRAVIKLCPSAALVVLRETPAADETDLTDRVVFVRPDDAHERLLLALIEARSLATQRRA